MLKEAAPFVLICCVAYSVSTRDWTTSAPVIVSGKNNLCVEGQRCVPLKECPEILSQFGKRVVIYCSHRHDQEKSVCCRLTKILPDSPHNQNRYSSHIGLFPWIPDDSSANRPSLSTGNYNGQNRVSLINAVPLNDSVVTSILPKRPVILTPPYQVIRVVRLPDISQHEEAKLSNTHPLSPAKTSATILPVKEQETLNVDREILQHSDNHKKHTSSFPNHISGGSLSPVILQKTELTSVVPVRPNSSIEIKFPSETENECGRAGPSFFVTNGRETELKELPWMAALKYDIRDRSTGHTSGQRWLCGGSLIHKDYVLTAAHCVDDKKLGNDGVKRGERYYVPLLVRLGEHNLFANPDCFTPSSNLPPVCTSSHDFPILKSNIIIHREFNKRAKLSDDIALIKLPTSATLSDDIHVLCLPPRDMNLDLVLRSGMRPFVAGWGVKNTTSMATSDVLLKTTVSAVNRDDCLKYYERHHITVTPEQLCFGGTDGRDSCGGDSGGPLFISLNSMRTKFYQIGIVSQGPTLCGKDRAPALYTNVISYLSWIHGHIVETIPRVSF